VAEVRLTSGWIRGQREDSGVLAFLGIPYGATTAGPNRFRPPVPVEEWEGVRDALEFGPSCPQPIIAGPAAEGALAMFGGIPEPSVSEDCLVLNVWTPDADQGRRPVVVYLHGGGHAMGSATWPVYHGAAMASRDAVVVTVNHRLGPLGYLYLGDLLGQEYAASGACGMLDLVAALEWVRDNIAGFGGDPGNVSIVGESGGGSKVAALLTMPSAAGLFHRASIMSGWFGLEGKTPAEARQITGRALNLLGLSAETAREVLTMPFDRLIDVSTTMGGIDSGLFPVVDGDLIAAQPLDAVTSGTATDVPLLIGTTRDEYSLFLQLVTMGAKVPREQAAAEYLNTRFGPGTTAVIKQYQELNPQLTPWQVLVAVATDGNVRLPALRLAEAKSATSGEVYMYRFDFASPLDPTLGAAHGLDLPFLFDTPDTAAATGPATGRGSLADVMCSAWVSFARDGHPSLAGTAQWPPYTVPQRATALFNLESQITNDPAGQERQAWSDEGAGGVLWNH
jgi:para-nitrobenzyl esterase